MTKQTNNNNKKLNYLKQSLFNKSQPVNNRTTLPALKTAPNIKTKQLPTNTKVLQNTNNSKNDALKYLALKPIVLCFIPIL